MDKILLTAFLSALAGFITAILSIVKLINEKESKTTDYRQAWTESVRTSLANLIGQLNAQVGHITSAVENKSLLTKIISEKEKNKDDSEFLSTLDIINNLNKDNLKENLNAIRQIRKEIHETYALTRLHFKPNDLSFNRIEQKFDVIMGILNELDKTEDSSKRATLKEKVHGVAEEITGYARDILKTEWETVKTGEPAYHRTKQWSIYGSVLMLFILISIGIHAGFQ